MPTPTGLPKVGETWERKTVYPHRETVVFRVIARGSGTYWSLRVRVLTINGQPAKESHASQLWVDAAWWFKKGELRYVGKL